MQILSTWYTTNRLPQNLPHKEDRLKRTSV
jgi:hypothetical protein